MTWLISGINGPLGVTRVIDDMPNYLISDVQEADSKMILLFLVHSCLNLPGQQY
jgi:hypothetical protein